MEYTIGTIVFDNWKITEKLGEGASGQVFKIVKEMDDITLQAALKVIRIPQSQDEVRHILNEGMTQDSVSTYFMQIVEDIKKEVKAMIQLKDHPNIVRCDDFVFIPAANQVGGDILIRMELLTPLNNYVTQGSMPEANVMQMARDLCSALDFCHKKGMVHRDIKPENIFVNAMGQFKLGDFGLARTAEKSTGGLSKKGTEGYMAPEVYLGKRYNHTVDIYSLGLVLYKSLNHNRLPFFPTSGVFSYADREEALNRRMSGDAMPRPVDASAVFGEVILKACAFDPAQRYQSAAEMLNAIGGQKVQSADWNTRVKTHTKNTNEDKVQYNKEKESVVTKKEEKQKAKKKGKAPIIAAVVLIGLGALGKYGADSGLLTSNKNRELDLVQKIQKETEEYINVVESETEEKDKTVEELRKEIEEAKAKALEEYNEVEQDATGYFGGQILDGLYDKSFAGFYLDETGNIGGYIRFRLNESPMSIQYGYNNEKAKIEKSNMYLETKSGESLLADKYSWENQVLYIASTSDNSFVAYDEECEETFFVEQMNADEYLDLYKYLLDIDFAGV